MHPYLVNRSITTQIATTYGLFVNEKQKQLLIPIKNAQGTILGYSKRAIDDKTPKYITPKGLRKSTLLYGLSEARDFIASKNEIVLVEGYFDVLGLASIGIRNVVAIMGSSLSLNQLWLARRHATKIVCLMDSDTAGQEQLARLCALSLKSCIQILWASLPAKDPDEARLVMPKKTILSIIKNAKPVVLEFIESIDGP